MKYSRSFVKKCQPIAIVLTMSACAAKGPSEIKNNVYASEAEKEAWREYEANMPIIGTLSFDKDGRPFIQSSLRKDPRKELVCDEICLKKIKSFPEGKKLLVTTSGTSRRDRDDYLFPVETIDDFSQLSVFNITAYTAQGLYSEKPEINVTTKEKVILTTNIYDYVQWKITGNVSNVVAVFAISHKGSSSFADGESFRYKHKVYNQGFASDGKPGPMWNAAFTGQKCTGGISGFAGGVIGSTITVPNCTGLGETRLDNAQCRADCDRSRSDCSDAVSKSVCERAYQGCMRSCRGEY